MKRVFFVTVLIYLFISSAFATKQWKFDNLVTHTKPELKATVLHNNDQPSRIEKLWFWKTPDERTLWAITIRFNTAEEHTRFEANMRENLGDIRINQPTRTPLDLIIFVDHLAAESPRDPQRWIRVLTAIHAVEALTPDALTGLENLLGLRLPREAFAETPAPQPEPELEDEFVVVNEPRDLEPQNTTTAAAEAPYAWCLLRSLNPFGARGAASQ